MKNEINQVKCPHCGRKIDVNEILYHQLKEESNKEFKEKLIAEKSKLEKELREELKDETSEQLKALEKELKLKSNQVKELNKTKAEIEMLKREKDELKEQITLEKEKEFTDKLKEEKIKLKKLADSENALKIKELEKQLEDQKELALEMKRKAEQGSVQLQGEAQEILIENYLQSNFPFDSIEEIRTGAKGADTIQKVNTPTKQNCGIIYYESKRTKEFQSSWINKFKTDMREIGATFGVLVTDAYPKGVDRLAQREGIWVCSFEEFKGLCYVLRESVVLLSDIISAQENKGDKMSLLYKFLTGIEFRGQIESIVESFSEMQNDLSKEKRAMESIWKKREKQINGVLLNTTQLYSSIKGIAGKSIKSIAALELSPSNDNE